MTNRMVDRKYLQNSQYQDARNLEARIALHRDYTTNPYPWFSWVFDQLHLEAGMRILEVGCGSGRLWTENSHRLPPNLDLTLADLSPGMLVEARREVGASLWARYVAGDVQSPPFAGQCFNVVIANHMLYHAPDIGLALKQLRRVLRPGGRLFAATNGAGNMSELTSLALQYEDAASSVWNQATLERFSLESGGDWLSTVFDQVQTLRYYSDLEVTAIEPIVAYLESMSSVEITPAIESLIRKRLEAHFAEHSSFHVSKAQGLLVGVAGDAKE